MAVVGDLAGLGPAAGEGGGMAGLASGLGVLLPGLMPLLMLVLLSLLLVELRRRLVGDPTQARWPWALAVVVAVLPGAAGTLLLPQALVEALLLGALSLTLLVTLWLLSVVSELRQTRARLRQANAELEARVRERTRALESARDTAEAASEAKSRFLATMTHELRTPLNAVLGATELLSRRPGLNWTDRHLLESAHDSGRHLLALVENVLDLSRIEAGRMPVVPAPFSLGECLHGALEAVRLAAERKGLSLELQGGARLPDWRLGDALLIKRVLINLLANAVKFTERGSVRLSLSEPQPGRLLIDVSDTGIGIPPAAQQRVFEPFRQADDTTTRKHGGSGLGLAITRELMQSMGGSVALDSIEGLGTTLHLSLPLPVCEDARPSELAAWRERLVELRPEPLAAEPAAQRPPLVALRGGAALPEGEAWAPESAAATAVTARAPASAPNPLPAPDRAAASTPRPAVPAAGAPAAPAAAPTPRPVLSAVPPAAPARPQGAGRRVLVVEDDMVNQMIASQMLGSDGWQVDLAQDGADALARLREGGHVLVLMDWQMPQMDGLEATRRLRAGEAGPQAATLPVIGVTANAHPEDRQACLAAGMNEVVTKPLSLQTLLGATRQWARADAA